MSNKTLSSSDAGDVVGFGFLVRGLLRVSDSEGSSSGSVSSIVGMGIGISCEAGVGIDVGIAEEFKTEAADKLPLFLGVCWDGPSEVAFLFFVFFIATSGCGWCRSLIFSLGSVPSALQASKYLRTTTGLDSISENNGKSFSGTLLLVMSASKLQNQPMS